MQLGSILTASPGEPCAVKEVEFHLMRKTGQGRQRHRVKAVLLPVSEADRQAAKRDAVSYLRTTPEYQERDGFLPPIPPHAVEQETVYKFLSYALHDAENPLTKFVGASDYVLFRDGIVAEQVAWLTRVYDKFITDEYPETGAPDMADLEEQALKK